MQKDHNHNSGQSNPITRIPPYPGHDYHGREGRWFYYDYRGLYSSILDQWLGLDAAPIVDGTYEQMSFLQTA